MIVETLILDGLYRLERLLVEESSRLEDLLRWRSMDMVAVLEQKRGSDGEDAAKKITDEQKANAKRRVAEAVLVLIMIYDCSQSSQEYHICFPRR